MEIPDPTTDSPAQAEADEDRDLAVDEAADEGRQRLWIRTLTPLLNLRVRESDPSDRVQFALDRLQIAACERAVRILQSDLSA